jgi:hypothetical protein
MFLEKVIVFLLLTLLHSSNSRQYNGGPTVDPGNLILQDIFFFYFIVSWVMENSLIT